MRFVILLPDIQPIELDRLTQLSERAGFDIICVGDHPLVFRELYVSLSVLAHNSKYAKISPLVTNVITRHIGVIASSIASIDELSGGRAILGVGTGDSSLYSIGRSAVKLKDFEESLLTLRSLLMGETVYVRGKNLKIEWVNRQVPIYITAEGPKTLRLAGRLADGVVIGTGLIPEIIQSSLIQIEMGAREAGRSMKDIDVWFFARANIDKNKEVALEGIKTGLAASAKRVFRFDINNKGIPEELLPKIKDLQRLYDYRGHMVPGHPINANLTDELGISKYLADRFSIIGKAEDCYEQLQKIESAGATQIILSGNLPDPSLFITTWGNDMISKIM
jgi:5,10-methylenetetrahydromethanopterin reductase